MIVAPADVPSQRTWSIILSHTKATWFCFGIVATGNPTIDHATAVKPQGKKAALAIRWIGGGRDRSGLGSGDRAGRRLFTSTKPRNPFDHENRWQDHEHPLHCLSCAAPLNETRLEAEIERTSQSRRIHLARRHRHSPRIRKRSGLK